MRKISEQAFEELIAGADAVSSPRGQPKVFERADGTVVKLFTRRGWLSSSRLRPHVKRFIQASHRLKRLKVPCVDVIDAFHVDGTDRDGVIYARLEGEVLRTRLSTPPLDRQTFENLIERFVRFVAQLNGKGIYFRGLHMGNAIIMPDGEFGLIDFVNCQFRRGPLSNGLRVRSLRPLALYQTDREAILAFGPGRFVDTYLGAAGHPAGLEARMRTNLARYLTEKIRNRKDVGHLALSENAFPDRSPTADDPDAASG